MFTSSNSKFLTALMMTTATLFAAPLATAQSGGVMEKIDRHVNQIEEQVIAWRRDIHEHPELSNREFRTAKLVSEHLISLGFEVRTGIATTGVVGILRGGQPGPVIALRADMDALPMKDKTGLPFASKVMTEYRGEQVPVSHSCGHDAHTAILMGTASVLAKMKSQLAGTIIFVFQPAEEGPPPGEVGGAPQMLAEGVFRDLKPEAMFGLHVEPGPVGKIYTRPDGFLAGATGLNIHMHGEGTHGAKPWSGNDLPSLAADIIKTMSVITSRKVNVIKEPSIVSLARIAVGTRGNILPAAGEMTGTIRTYSAARLSEVKAEIETAVSSLSNIYGAKAEVSYSDETPPTVNDKSLYERVLPSLRKAAGPAGVDGDALRRPAAEDFSFFAREIPSVYYILGSTKDFTTFDAAPSNHSESFDIDEDVLAVGVRSQVTIVTDYLSQKGS